MQEKEKEKHTQIKAYNQQEQYRASDTFYTTKVEGRGSLEQVTRGPIKEPMSSFSFMNIIFTVGNPGHIHIYTQRGV